MIYKTSHISVLLLHANTYRDDVQLFIDGDTLLSQEGTTQGDFLAMAMYAVAITPLIRRSLEDDETKQVWFADDAMYHTPQEMVGSHS